MREPAALMTPAFCRTHADDFSDKKTGISRKTERRPARTNGLYLKQLRCDSSLCRYEKIFALSHAALRQPFSRLPAARKAQKKPPRGETSVPLLEAVAASAVLAVAGIAHMDGLKLAVAAIHVELALRNAARNAAVVILRSYFTSSQGNMRKSTKIIPNPVDKAPVLW